MAASRKYENLPDIDAAAPDVYETPDLADDVSTVPGTSALSPSNGSEDGHTSDEGIDRRRWRSQAARSKFQTSRVSTDRVDFSDRLNLRRQSYRTYSSRRRRGQYDEAEDDASDEEGLESRLVRLRMEVEQIKILIEERSKDEPEHDDHTVESVDRISEALEALHNDHRGATGGPEAQLSQAVAAQDRSTSTPPTKESAAQDRSDITQDMQIVQLLSRTADFDARLTLLEQGLGLDASNMPETGNGSNKPILPTLHGLEQLVGIALSQPDQLEAAQTKTRQLLKDAERLLRANAELSAQSGETPASSKQDEKGARTTDQESKVNALFGLFPTIDTISPTVPLLLDRLRTLRLLHTSAATAHATLEDVEQQQQEQAADIKQWRQALEQVESNMSDGQTVLVENMQQMGEKIKNLESRLPRS